MTVEEAWNRGNNLVGVSVATLAGLAFAPEMILEKEWPFKIDDFLLLMLGAGAVSWYRKHAYSRSIVPFLFTLTGLLIKIGAIFLEFKEHDDVGDDFGGLVLFISATLFMLWLYIGRKYKE